MQRIIKALLYSLEGLKAAVVSEPAFRQELFLLLLCLPIICVVEVSFVSKALMASSIVLILIAELVNTAIETIIDRFSQEIHPLSKKAKDVGSAVVFVALVNAGVVWGIILFNS